MEFRFYLPLSSLRILLELRNAPAFQRRCRFSDPLWTPLSWSWSGLYLRGVGQPRKFLHHRHSCRSPIRFGFCFHRRRSHLCGDRRLWSAEEASCGGGSQSTLSLVVANKLGFGARGKAKPEKRNL